MDAEEAAFIAAVVADPDDDTVRLAYADWLQERGQPDRARLIRVQCQIASLQTEETTLLKAHSREWGRELYIRGAHSWKFHRGFPEEISIPIDNFIREYQELNSFTPLRYLDLNGATDDTLRRFSRIPILAQAQSLEIDQATENGHLSGHYGMAGVVALSSSEYLTNLRRLNLHSHQIGEAESLRLSQSPNFANLTHLTLSAPSFDQGRYACLTRMIHSPHLSNLQSIRLGSEAFGLHEIREIRRTTRPPNITP